MGTSAGPNLAGIGRGGDSNLVLEMDAHDAKSYPGEPTYNVMANPLPLSGWTVSNHLGSTATVTYASEDGVPHMEISDVAISTSDYPRINMAALLNTITDNFSISFEAKCNIDGTNLSIALYSGGSTKTTQAATLTPEWKRYTFENITTGFTLDDGYLRPNETVSGAIRYIRKIQVEQKTYSTPFVGAQHNNPMLRGPSSRPASVNLMIHGNVGTGQTFSDSSPSKHTITANNVGSAADPVHSGVSKFSGGSIYFDGSTYSGAGSYLSVPDSTDWNFGTEDFTVDFWIRLNNLGTSSGGGDYRPHQGIIGNYDNTSGFRVSFTHKGTVEDGIWLYGPGGSVRAGNITGWVVDTWYHIAVVRSSGNASIYKDGVLRAGPTSWATSVGDSSYPLIMGMDPRANPPTHYPLHGYLDEIRVTKGTALWTSAFTPPTRRNLSAPVVDRSGNDNGGNFNTTDMTDVATYRVGEVIRPIDSAVWDFDGTDDLTTIGYHSSLDTPNAATFSVWLYPEANGEFLSRGTSDNGTDPDNPRFYVFWNLQKFYFDWSETGSDQYVTTAAGGFPANTWVNVVATVVAGGRMEVYINGGVASYETRANADSMANPLPNTNDPILLGGAPWIPRYFAGKIASIGIYDVALTDQQIVENFNQQRNRFKI